MNYVQTLREHHFIDGLVIPKNKVLKIIEQRPDTFTVEFSGHKKMLRRSQVKVVNPDEIKKSAKSE